ncbi:MAG: Ig-like domain-containing protein [Cyclobacteriaceae bacterium]
MKNLLLVLLITVPLSAFCQVDTSFIYKASTPYGSLDIRIAKSATRYYYLQEDKTISFRENSPGVKTNTYRDMTSWDSSPYSEGNMREKNGTSDAFIMNYRLLFPQGYQPNHSEGYPMIVMMHGAGERGNCWKFGCHWADASWRPSSNTPPAPTDIDHELLNNDHNLSHGGKQHLDARNLAGTKLPDDPTLAARAFPGFVLFAQNLNGWDTQTTQDLIKLVRLVTKKHNVDPDRIYIHGLSNGGIAVYDAIKRAPWLFAAALPMSAPTDAGVTSAGLQSTVAHITFWMFQGGKDTEPAPGRTESYVKIFRQVGAEVRYSRYENLGHGTWNTAYAEPEFFSWMRSKSKNKIHVFYGNPVVCGSTGQGVKLGFSAGFLAYQWEKDGAIISGAAGHEYVATQPGVYRARFSRISKTPGSGQWEKWSPAVTVTVGVPAKPEIIPLTTTHLRGPDNAGVNTIQLKSSTEADKYYWYKNGALIDIPYNSQDDTVSLYTITTTSTTYNGAYTLKAGTMNGCLGSASDAVNLFFNNSAPYLADSNVPGSFTLVAASGSTANLAWQDRSTIESAYEIWRRAPGGTFIMVGRTEPNEQSFTDRGLLPSTTYEYKIRALNNQGRSRYAPGDDVSTNLVVTTNNDTNAPAAPANLKMVKNTTSSISLAWTASTDNNGSIKHYVVYYGSQSKVTNSADPSYTLTGLPMNTSYNITVKAVDNAGLFSPASNQVTGTTSVKGLWYGHSTGAWTDLDQITNWNDPEFTGWVPNFTLAPRTQEEYFNFEFTGYLYIETTGSYYFYLNSDDGSRIYIDGNQVLDFDGVHEKSGANEGFGVRSAAIPLSAGPHDIRVIFFENISGQYLSVGYQGADTDNLKMYIPDAALTSGTAGGTTNKLPVVNITSPQNDQQFSAPASVNIAATASDTDGNVTKVEFYNGTTKLGEDLTSPYAYTWNNVAAGNYTLSAKATDNDGGSGTASVDIVVTSSIACAGAGKIQQELWTGISGTMISSIPVDQTPASVTDLTLFEGPANIGDSYGRRIRGYICTPVSGTYILWISSNDNSELWLSTDANAVNKAKIAFVSGYTNVRQWDKYTSQKSAAITLVANQKYYIEALHKEGVGTDHVAVGWQLPGGALERPIPGMRLIPFTDSGTSPVPVVSITSPSDGQSFTAPASVNIAANASVSGGTIVKVEFYNGTAKLGEDVASPYSFAWNNVPAGNYTVNAKAIDNTGSSATASVDIVVTSGGGSACSGTGTILREVWTGIQYNDVASIPLHESPDGISELAIFEDPTNVGDNYGTRVSGYLCVPATGAYTFWISSNDNSELWLSTDANPSNKARIAWVTGYTNVREWTKFASQKSAVINMIAGQRYYVEALHKEGVGSDHMAVGWQLPNGTQERPIAGNRLSPFESQTTAMTAFGGEATMMQTVTSDMQEENVMMAETSENDEASLEVFPNPASSGVDGLTISGHGDAHESFDATVEIQHITGEVVYSWQFSCEGNCGEFVLPVDSQLTPGVYLVHLISNGKRSSKRLLVK